MSACLLDKRQIRRSFANAALSYDGMAALQRKVGSELMRKIALHQDAAVVDIGCGTGFFTHLLQKQALLKNIVALDIAVPMLLQTRQRLQQKAVPLVCADAEQLPFVGDCFDGVVSNLALQWCLDMEAMLSDVRRILHADGQFAFSTFGANALYELKAAWATVDDYPHVNHFASVAEIRRQLQYAGFADICVESHTYKTKYASVIDLMRELKGIGAHNVSHERNRKLTSKGQLHTLLHAYPADELGLITASFEIIYAQAANRV